MKLVIVESPGKIQKVQSILGSDYRVVASVGHVRDLPQHSLSIDITQGFGETYEVTKDKKKVVSDLKKAARTAEVIYLAMDPDREGEAIAWHIAELLPQRDQKKLQRIAFDQVTEKAIREALNQPREIDIELVDAQRTRRVLDRLVGYQVSPLLHEWGLHSSQPLSAGRVQSAALSVIVEREQERRGFVPIIYHNLSVQLQKEGHPPFQANLVNPPKITSLEELQEALEALRTAIIWQVNDIDEKTQSIKPPAPFTTSTLQQDASKRLGLKPAATQKIAQQLYEKGTITYIRTDSTHVAPEAQQAALQMIADSLGTKYLPKHPATYKSKPGAQEAHEAIRPTQINADSLKFDTQDQFNLYTLIWQRFIASQMAEAEYAIIEGEIIAGDGETPLPYLFQVRSRHCTFDGFYIIYPNVSDVDEEEDQDLVDLPPLQVGDRLIRVKLDVHEKKTKPPHRYTQARLIAQLERLGIGRPSTFADTVDTILDRQYVKMDKNHVVPTSLGEAVTQLLQANFPTIFDTGFTATMETLLDRIATGHTERTTVLSSFWNTFEPALNQSRHAAYQHRLIGENCPKCGQPLLRRDSKKGAFIGCSGYPDCTYSRNLLEEKKETA